MPDSLTLLTTYFLRIAPGVLLSGILLLLLGKRALAVRIAVYIGLFILIHDAGATSRDTWQRPSPAPGGNRPCCPGSLSASATPFSP